MKYLTVRHHVLFLDIVLRQDLRWSDHINAIVSKASKQLNIMKSLQFILDRKTLETIYFSFIRPLMEYGCVIWDGCTQAESLRLENIQLAAARIISGAMRTKSNAKLYEETGFVTLEKRRELLKLTQMYKIINGLVPSYLSDIVFDNPNSERHYYTRQADDLPSIRARTDVFNNSFFPSAIRLWNQLPLDVRNSTTLTEFKNKIKITIPRPVKDIQLYYIGSRFPAIIHTRLRLGRSQLNAHLFKIGVLESPDCRCGHGIEDVWHYIFSCPRYTVHRDHLHNSVTPYAAFTLETVLYGATGCNFDDNKAIFLSVQDYILNTQRFKTSDTT